jgi:toxin YoeB
MIKKWYDDAWEDYLYWQRESKQKTTKINKLIRDIERNGYSSLGKPEPLKGELQGFWSARIDSCNRIVFKIKNDCLEIMQCGSYQHKL